MIQFDKFFHLVVLDVNYPMCIFMNTYKKLVESLETTIGSYDLKFEPCDSRPTLQPSDDFYWMPNFHLDHQNAFFLSIWVMWNWMVSMTTYKIILKNGMYLHKYSYLSSNSTKNTKLGIKLILSHGFFSWLSVMQLISIECSWIFMKAWEIKDKIQEKGGIQRSCLLL